MNPNLIQNKGPLPLGLRSPNLGVRIEGSDVFQSHLERSTGALLEVKFSSHAQQRLDSRGVNLGDAELQRLSTGVESLRTKGVRDGLVVLGDHRFVVSAENRTVITVLSSKDREVFTNIQGVAFE